MTKKSNRRLNVYANLSHARKTKKDHLARKKAEYLATLPKHPIKRFLYRAHPKRVVNYWFSRKGAFMALKIIGASTLLLVILAGGLFAYFRKDIDQIRPSELAKRVQTTVTRYYDRNDILLWEDKGNGNYKLVVKGSEISKVMKQATIAIEDRDFYNHKGISPTALLRAAINNSQGDSTQGGSTLTQQLVKQVFFADEASNRGLSGIPRKIKELILAIETERIYNKEQILDLYLNESPYGGRRNGVESAAQTYFGISAKNLNLSQSALLAAIPNQPGLLDPYNAAGHTALIKRQHKVLDGMVEQGYITKGKADEAKKVAILDTIKRETDQYTNIKAPHFVQMVRSELEQELGKATVGRGGLIVKTTLDLRVQNKLQAEMNSMFSSYYPNFAGFSNGAGTIEDVRTGQIIAMLGSRNFNHPGFGQDNAAAAFIQPGSSIKPLVYAELFQNKGAANLNFGSGSILADNPTNFSGYKPQNADGGFRGSITLRRSLALSRNIPAIKAMQVSGVDQTLKTIRALGNKYYCTQGAEKEAGLSASIGGCGTRMIDHTNALASLARGGTYMPTSTILKVTNNSGEVLEQYKAESKKVIDPQSAFIVNDILGDSTARLGLFGRTITPTLDAAGIKVAVKTGTSDRDRKPKDIWTIAYTPSLAGSVWLGNPDTTPLVNGNSSIPAQVLDPVMAYATQLYKNESKAKAGEWFVRPKGIQQIGREIFPSWYNKAKAQTGVKLVFDKVSKKKATDCTPSGAKIELTVIKTIDPVTKAVVYMAPDGYDASKEDDAHKCSDASPDISGICIDDSNNITIRVSKGTNTLQTLDVGVNGKNVASINVTGSGTYTTNYNFSGPATVTATVTDIGYYTDTASQAYSGSGNCVASVSQRNTNTGNRRSSQFERLFRS